MKRSEFEEELDELVKFTTYNGSRPSGRQRLLSWFDSVQRDLGYTRALRDRVEVLVEENVALDVRASKAELLADSLGRDLREADSE